VKKYNAISVDFSPSNEEGLAFVYVDFGEFNYFTICFSASEQEEIYIENSNQKTSVYSNDISYKLYDNELIFEFGDKVAEDINLNTKILIKLELDKEEFLFLEKSLKEIFKCKISN